MYEILITAKVLVEKKQFIWTFQVQIYSEYVGEKKGKIFSLLSLISPDVLL